MLNGELEVLEKNLEGEKNNIKFKYKYWYWRTLLDIYYFKQDYEKLQKNFEEFLFIQNEIKLKCGINKNAFIYGQFLIRSLGMMTSIIDAAILKKLNYFTEDIYILNDIKPVNVFIFNKIKEIIEFKELNLKSLNKNDIEMVQESFLYFGISRENGFIDFYLQRENAYIEYKEKFGAIMQINENETYYIKNILKNFGIKEDDWFVVLHVRETKDTSIRDCKIETYDQSISEIIKRGGWVIRIGDNKTTILNRRDKYLDLANSNTKNIFDGYLLALCKFAIVTNSGPEIIPYYFNKPRVYTNIACLRHIITTNTYDIVIPFIYLDNTNKYITLNEYLKMNISMSSYNLNNNLELTIEKNSPQIIKSATIEMLDGFYKNDFIKTKNSFQLICKQNNLKMCAYLPKKFINTYPNYLQ
jgi:putative glycosyltransferase (TIGR04372 family)